MTRDEFKCLLDKIDVDAYTGGYYFPRMWRETQTGIENAKNKLLSAYDEMAEEIERTNNDMVWAATKMSDMETSMDAIHNKVDELRKENDRLMDKIDEQRAEMEAYRLICNCKTGEEVNNE